MDLDGKTLSRATLFLAFGLILYFCFRIIQPFLMPILLAVILSALFAPLYDTLYPRVGRRSGLAALLICLVLTVAILAPILLLSIALAHEANVAYDELRTAEILPTIQRWLDPASSPILEAIRPWVPSFIDLDQFDLGSRLEQQARIVLGGALNLTRTFASGAFNFLMDYIIMMTVLFFLLRDSRYFAESIRRISPLTPQEEDIFVDRFRTVARATVLGNLATATAQGTLSGTIFLALGLPSPVLWGSITALLSLVPFVGTALVWAPWTVYLLASGATGRAILFLILQIVIVGGIDNVLRPLLIEGSVKMHTLVVFFSIIGGIGYFGILGMFIGPLIFAIAIAFVDFYWGESEPVVAGPSPPSAPITASGTADAPEDAPTEP